MPMCATGILLPSRIVIELFAPVTCWKEERSVEWGLIWSVVPLSNNHSWAKEDVGHILPTSKACHEEDMSWFWLHSNIFCLVSKSINWLYWSLERVGTIFVWSSFASIVSLEIEELWDKATTLGSLLPLKPGGNSWTQKHLSLLCPFILQWVQ